jgi:copper transport protein
MRIPITPAVLLVVLALSATASGHALYQSSDPAANSILPGAPSSVTVHVTERASPGSASIAITNAAGDHFEVNGTRISSVDSRVIYTDLGPLEPGVYTVLWRVTSADDGHPTAGSFGFCVQDINGTCPGQFTPGSDDGSASPVSPVDVVLRAASYISTAASVGAAAFLLFVWNPSTDNLPAQLGASARRGARWAMLWGGGHALGLAAYSAAWLAWSLSSTSNADAAKAIGGSVFLQSLLVRALLAAALGAAFLLTLRASQGAEGVPPGRPAALLAFLLGLAVVAVIAASSHMAASAAIRTVGVLVDGTHVLFISMWVGGLMCLLVAHQSLRGPKNALLAKRVLTRFSTYAAVAVTGVVAAGFMLSLGQVGSLENLTSTPFGLVVTAKVGLVLPLVALGAHNHFRSIPQLTDPARVVEAAARVGRNVRVEALLAVVVLLLSGLLASLAPATSLDVPTPEPQAFFLEQVKDGIEIQLQVYPPPGAPGLYVLSILLTRADTGALYLNSTNATGTFTLTNSTYPQVREVMLGPHDNHYFLETTAFSKPGKWRVDVSIQRTDGFDIVATFYVDIKEARPPAP